MSEATFDDILESALERAYDAGASHNNRILWEGLEALTSTTAARLRSLKVDPPSRIDVVRRFAAEERPLHVGVEWVRELAAEIDALTPPRPEPVAWAKVREMIRVEIVDTYTHAVGMTNSALRLIEADAGVVADNIVAELESPPRPEPVARVISVVEDVLAWCEKVAAVNARYEDAKVGDSDEELEDAEHSRYETFLAFQHWWESRTHVPPVRGGEGAVESYWWCDVCSQRVEGRQVTYHEYHDGCGGKVREVTTPTPALPVVTEAMDRAAWAKIEESCVIEVYDEARVATDVTIVDIHAALRAALTAASEVRG